MIIKDTIIQSATDILTFHNFKASTPPTANVQVNYKNLLKMFITLCSRILRRLIFMNSAIYFLSVVISQGKNS